MAFLSSLFSSLAILLPIAMDVEDEKPSKRTTNPGVRVIGRRIYDSSNGKTCHQCRQKTMDLVASCNAVNNGKQCKLNFCHKCLFNRYGEKADEVAVSNDWACPKCRGNCNCSFCRKKIGQKPTGILAYKAKASGLSSVSELLEVAGVDSFAYQRKAKPENEGSGSGNSEHVSETDAQVVDAADGNKKMAACKVKKPKAATNKPEVEIQIDAQLPEGECLTNLVGIEIPAEEIGHVYQFLEFCSTFGKVLELKEGEAESVVSEIFSCGHKTKRQQYSSVITMMIHLLELISRDREMSWSLHANDGAWFNAVGECVSESGVFTNVFPPETFEAGVAEYEKMDSSKRLKLLNFLCDESLSTWEMRSFIENSSAESETKRKEAKQKAAAAREKEKKVKQKMEGELVKAHMEKHGTPLSIEEHQAILSRVKAEAKEAREEMLEAQGVVSREGKRCAALRTEPVLVDDNGSVLWKLKCFEEEPKFLLQELGLNDDSSSHEKWLAFKPEQKEDIEKYVTAKRMERKRAQM